MTRTAQRRRWTRWTLGVILACLAVALGGVVASLLPPRLEMTPQDGLLLTQVTVVNPGKGRRANQTVVVRGGRIESIDDRAPPGLLPRVTRHLAGRYVLPGLIDVHVHLPPAVGGVRAAFETLFLSFGITTVCQVGDGDAGLAPTGVGPTPSGAAAPRVLQCGQLFDGDGASGAYSRRVTQPGAAADAVADLAANGIDCMVASATLSSEVVTAARDTCRQYGVPFIGHLPAPVAPDDAGRTASGVGVEGVAADWEHLDAAAVPRVAQRAAEAGIAYAPTLSGWARITQLDDRAFLQSASSRLLPRFYRDVLWDPHGGIAFLAHQCGSGALWLELRGETTDTATAPAGTRALDAINQVMARIHAAGGRVLAGSNTPYPVVLPGLSLHEEMTRLVALGMSPEEAWGAATGRTGETLGVPLLGTLQPGAPADLLIFREDPTRDLRGWQSLEAVMVDGRIYAAHSLTSTTMAYARYVARPLYDWLSMAAVRYVLRRQTAAD